MSERHRNGRKMIIYFILTYIDTITKSQTPVVYWYHEETPL